MNILVTSTSFQDSPGNHQELLKSFEYNIKYLRGPLEEKVMLENIENVDGLICGDDEITENVINKGIRSKLKVISKYGVGLDKINVEYAFKKKLIVENCIGVNQTTVAEHVFNLMLFFNRKMNSQVELVKAGKWDRLVGNELFGKTLGLIGMGSIGKEVAKRAVSFGINVIAYDKTYDEIFLTKYGVIKATLNDLLKKSNIISLHTPLNRSTKDIINKDNMQFLSKDAIIINTARGELINEEIIINLIKEKKIAAYLTDVLDKEPIRENHPFLQYENIIITPHIGSRTKESIERQGTMAVENLIKNLK